MRGPIYKMLDGALLLFPFDLDNSSYERHNAALFLHVHFEGIALGNALVLFYFMNQGSKGW